MRRESSEGFTLVEVLVALAVLAIALGALVKGGGSAAANAAYLRDKTLAQWVAMNKVAELRLAPTWPALGVSRGRAEMAGREWAWTVRVTKTSGVNIRRMDVEVGPADEPAGGSIIHLIAFLPRTS